MITRRILLLLTCGFFAATLPAAPAHLVLMIGEDEYKTWETLPEFAAGELKSAGFRVSVIHADKANKNHFPGLIAALRDADLLVVSVRRRTPIKEQLDAVRAYLVAGKPLVGIRTASHAFSPLPKETITDLALGMWKEFDPEVLGGHYTGHYGRDPAKVTAAVAGHAILKGVAVDRLIAHGGLYKNTPLEKTATLLLTGTIAGQATEPVAWTHRCGPKQAKVFYTSMGHWDDFKNPEFRRLLLNGVHWALAR